MLAWLPAHAVSSGLLREWVGRGHQASGAVSHPAAPLSSRPVFTQGRAPCTRHPRKTSHCQPGGSEDRACPSKRPPERKTQAAPPPLPHLDIGRPWQTAWWNPGLSVLLVAKRLNKTAGRWGRGPSTGEVALNFWRAAVPSALSSMSKDAPSRRCRLQSPVSG